MTRQNRIPKLLWKLFGDKICTLGEGVARILPDLYFLTKPDDSYDYKSLLYHSFVVFSEAALSFSSPSSSSFRNHTMPRECFIIEKVMSIFSLNGSSSSNVLWKGCHECVTSNPIIDMLSSSPWSLLLHKIGDDAMVYIFLHCSIFIHRRGQTYQQISGPPVTTMVFVKNFSNTPGRRNQVGEEDTSVICRKYELENDVVFVQRVKKRARPFKWQRFSIKRRRLNLPESMTCLCCLKLEKFITSENKSTWDKNERKAILYNTEDCSSALPKNHILITLKPNNGGASSLFYEIFGGRNSHTEVKDSFVYTKCSHQISSSFCLYHSLLKSLKVMIGRARSCRHSRLLNKHCGSSFSDPEKAVEKSPLYCSNHQVVSFLWAACRSIIPVDLLGSCSNWRKLTRNISKYVKLRQYEKFSMKQCMYKIKAWGFSSSVNQQHSWCWGDRDGGRRRGGSHGRLKHKLTTKWVSWLFSSFIPALLRANFYITESQQGCKNVYYYRKDVWRRSIENSIEELKESMYISLDSEKIDEIVRRKDKGFDFSKLRFCPKEGGMRPLANLRSMSIYKKKTGTGLGFRPCKRSSSTNTWIRGFHAVLTRLRQRESSRLGCSVFDYNEVYKKMYPFIVDVRRCTRGEDGVVDTYLVVADVMKAFDSIDQDRLLGIMEEVIPDGEYSFGVEKKVFSRNGCFFVKDQLYFRDRVYDVRPPSHGADCVVVDHGRRRSMNKLEIISGLKEHVKVNLLQFGDSKDFYIQNVGIPQGSVVSPLLCSFYYGHVENTVIRPYVERLSPSPPTDPMPTCDPHSHDDTNIPPDYILMRFVDDFLLLSTSKTKAENFLRRIRRGFRAYNCRMNENKFSTNFVSDPPECTVSPSHAPRVFVDGEGNRFHKWSGLLINSCTLEIQADYTRYIRTHLSSTLTVSHRGRPLGDIKKRLYNFLGPKCHPLFLDSNMNSTKVVMLNVYQCFLFSAMKLHCYICSLSGAYTLEAGPIFDAVWGSLGYMYKHMKRRMFCVGSLTGIRPLLKLKKREVLWLGLKAYISALTRKQSRHKELIVRLRRALARYSDRLLISSDLEYATASSNSSLLWKIKY